MENELENEVMEKENLEEEKDSEKVKDVLADEVVQEQDSAPSNSEPTAADLIKQQVLQSEYVEKMNALLNKETLTDEDVQTVEFVKSELLSQLLGVTVFSSTLGMDDSKIMGAETLSTHLTNMYVKAALLREKMERKRLAQLEKMDVADAYFGPNQEGANSSYNVNIVTDVMLTPRDHHQLKIGLINASPAVRQALMLSELANDPKARLTEMMSGLVQEFKDKTTPAEQQGFSAWAETLVSGLSKMNSKGAMLQALQGISLGQSLARMTAAKDVVG